MQDNFIRGIKSASEDGRLTVAQVKLAGEMALEHAIGKVKELLNQWTVDKVSLIFKSLVK